MRRLAYDFFMFIQILFFVPYVLLLLLPLRGADRMLGTRMHAAMVRLTKHVANA